MLPLYIPLHRRERAKNDELGTYLVSLHVDILLPSSLALSNRCTYDDAYLLQLLRWHGVTIQW